MVAADYLTAKDLLQEGGGAIHTESKRGVNTTLPSLVPNGATPARTAHRTAGRRDNSKCQNDGVQNGGACFRRSGAAGAPAVSRPNIQGELGAGYACSGQH